VTELNQPAPPGAPPSKPFDIDDYTRALRQLGASAQDLQGLLTSVERDGPRIEAMLKQASKDGREVVDHAFHLALVLVIFLIACALGAAIAYRWAAAHIPGRRESRATG
jgi:hypothetical protein